MRNIVGAHSFLVGQGGRVGPSHRLLRLVALPIIAVTALGFALLSGGCTIQVQIENNIGQGINQIRARAGLPPLTADPRLAAVARDRAQDMANLNYFSHSPPDGCPVRCLIERSGITPGWTGEVMAWDTTSVAGTAAMSVSMWSNSPPHIAVIDNRCFTRMGAGVAFTPEGKSYLVVVFEGNPPTCEP